MVQIPPTTEQMFTLFENACRAALIFHGPRQSCRRDQWQKITGSVPETTSVLCDVMRLCLDRYQDYCVANGIREVVGPAGSEAAGPAGNAEQERGRGN